MFSKTCEYAIRAMLFVAQKTMDGSRVGVREIAGGIDAPEHFIAKILQELARQGLVLSVKGPHGGFYLDAALRKTPLAAIVKAVDGDQLFTACALGLTQCSDKHPCPLHARFVAIRSDISKVLQQHCLGDLQASLERELTFLKRV